MGSSGDVYVWHEINERGKEMFRDAGIFTLTLVRPHELMKVPRLLVQAFGYPSYRKALEENAQEGIFGPLVAVFWTTDSQDGDYPDSYRHVVTVVRRSHSQFLVGVASCPLSYPLLATHRRLFGSPNPPRVDDPRLGELLNNSALRCRQMKEFEKLRGHCTHCRSIISSKDADGRLERLLPTSHPSLEEVADYVRGGRDPRINLHCLLCPNCTHLAAVIMSAHALMA